MKKLVSSSDAAKILGLSLQGVHYRIKKGQLESIKKDGKIFVYVQSDEVKIEKLHNSSPSQKVNDYRQLEDKIFQSKDEQIRILKKTIKFMKTQYTSEIERIDKNQKQVLQVFQSEVDLLKSAFNEMRNIYKIDHQKSKPTRLSQSVENEQVKFIKLKDFFTFMREHRKSDSEIKKIILEKVKSGDKRFIYNKKSKELLICKSDFLDII
ncbi:MAG: DNA-binding protein [Arcobacter sp.]|nr:MAG: DNA-binding protein [Arcobacter sp.]